MLSRLFRHQERPGSLLHLSELLEEDDDLVQILATPALQVGARSAYVLCFGTSSDRPQELEFVTAWGASGKPAVPQGTRLALEEYPSAHILVNNPHALQFVSDVKTDERLDEHLREMILGYGGRAMALIPLSRLQFLTGFILLSWSEPQRFSRQDLESYRTLMNTTAMAVENRLYLRQSLRALGEVGKSEMLLRSLIDATPDWVFIKDRQHRFVMVNRSYADAFHMEPEELIGKNNLDIGFPEELVKGNPEKGIRGIWVDDKTVIESGQTLSIPRDLIAVNGKLHVFDTIKIPLRDASGNVWGLLGFARDRTELKLAEDQLRKYQDHLEELVEVRTAQLKEANKRLKHEIEERERAEARIRADERFLQTVFDGIQDGISVLDKNLTVLRVNPAMEKWYAHTMPLKGQACYSAYHLRSEPCEVCPTLRAMKEGTPKMEEIPLTGPRGVEGWLELYSFPIFDENQEITGVVEYVRDISDRKRMEQYVLRTERLAAMGRLAAALAHEINNPLQAIGSSLELILDFPLAEDRRLEYLKASRNEIERLKGLTSRILDFARPPQLVCTPTDVGELIAHALSIAGQKLQQRKITIYLDLPDDLPPAIASRDHLTQVFLNLVINAMEAMPDGGELHVSSRELEDQVEVRLRDTGAGLTADAQAMIFEPFYTTKEAGIGLGLAISHSIIEKHGGIITAGNAPDGGAVFTVLLPRAYPAMPGWTDWEG